MNSQQHGVLGTLTAVLFASACGVDLESSPGGSGVSKALTVAEDAAVVVVEETEVSGPVCHDDLGGAVSDACVACGELECAASAAACGNDCRSLLTCVTEQQCEPGSELPICALTYCGDCIAEAPQAKEYGDCLVERCPAECAALPLSAPEDAGQAPAPVDAGAIEAGPACEDRIDEILSPQCTACSEALCGAQLSACGDGCRGLMTCVSDQCEGDRNDLSCITASCGSCLAGDSVNTALAYADCMGAACSSVCPLFQPQQPPPPPPSSCHDDLPGSIGDTCLSCAQAECTAEVDACEGDCGSLITCVAEQCAGLESEERTICAVTNCADCLGGVGQAQPLMACVSERCVDACAPLVSGDGTQGGSSGDSGYDDGPSPVGGTGDGNATGGSDGAGETGGATGGSAGESNGGGLNGGVEDDGDNEPPKADRPGRRIRRHHRRRGFGSWGWWRRLFSGR